MKRLCTICARGSKGVKNKNVREFRGQPLIATTLKMAKQSGLFDCVAVSSDSAQILEVSQQWGADYLIERPAALATDDAPKVPTIQHAVRWVEEKSWLKDLCITCQKLSLRDKC